MHDHGELVSHVIFGWDPFWVSIVLFVITYAAIISDRVNRAVVAGLGAVLMIMLGVLSQQDAVQGVDFNTLGLLTGMMIIVSVTRRSGVFQYVAIWSAKKVKADPWGILLMLTIITAVFSALLDNVTTVLLIAPVTLLITAELEQDPYPYLFAEIMASNIGGAATLIGDPPNIMIGSAVGLSFNDFLLNMAPIMPVILAVTMLIIYVIWGRGLKSTLKARGRIMSLKEKEAITDKALLKKSAVVLGLVIGGFLFAHPLGLEPATIAMGGAALLLLLANFDHSAGTQSKRVQKTFGEVEWITIFFFIGLFIVVHGIERAGVLEYLANELVQYTRGDMTLTAMMVLWMSAILSTIVDNIPFVATMIPLIKSMAPTLGGADQLMPLWWSLAMGACLGGNGSLIGASANLIVAGAADRAGHHISFLKFLLLAFPLMLVSVAIASVYVYLRYL
jgi:Na+/H+ antiporter NhaD/arsenite permease-like protein